MIFILMVLLLRPGDLDGAVKSLADVLPDMIRLAECEKACQLDGGGDREDETPCQCT